MPIRFTAPPPDPLQAYALSLLRSRQPAPPAGWETGTPQPPEIMEMPTTSFPVTPSPPPVLPGAEARWRFEHDPRTPQQAVLDEVRRSDSASMRDPVTDVLGTAFQFVTPSLRLAPQGFALAQAAQVVADPTPSTALRVARTLTQADQMAGDESSLAAAPGGGSRGLSALGRVFQAFRTSPPPRPPVSAIEGFHLRPNMNLKTKFVDEFTPSLEMEKAAGGVPIPQSVYAAQREAAGASGKVRGYEIEMRRIWRPIEAKGLTSELNRYMELKRHEENFLRPEKAENYQTPGDMSLADVINELTAMSARLGPQNMAVLERAANATRRQARNLMDEYVDSGMIPRESAEEMWANNRVYAPLHRLSYLSDKTEGMPVGLRTFNVRSQPYVKPIKGSDLPIEPPLEGFTRNMYNMLPLAQRNKPLMRIGKLAEDPRFAGAIREIQEGEPLLPGEGPVTGFVDGTKRSYAVPKEVSESIAGMTPQQLDLFHRIIRNTNRVAVEGFTRFNPPFHAGNILRDASQAALKSSEVGLFKFGPKQWLEGFWQGLTEGPWYETYLNSGAAMSGFFERQGTVKKSFERIVEPTWKKVGRNLLPWSIPRYIGEKLELPSRIGYLKMLDDAGVPMNELGFRTRTALPDFGSYGSWMRAVSPWAPLLNARKEGLRATLSSLQNNPVKASMSIAAMVGLPTVLTYIHNVTNYPDVWDDIRKFEKKKSIVLIRGREKNKDGDYINVHKIPGGDIFELFGAPIIWGLEALRKKDPSGFLAMAADAVGENFPVPFRKDGKLSWQAPFGTLTPPFIKAVAVEPVANKNLYTEREIEVGDPRKQPGGVDPKTIYDEYTPEWIVKTAQALPDFLGISPKQIQNALISQFGAPARLLAGDIRKEARDPLSERTGMGALGRLFSGAIGGGVDEERRRSNEPGWREVNTRQYARSREARRMFNEAKSLPPEQRLRLIDAHIKKDPDIRNWMTVYNTVMEGIKDKSSYEKTLDSLSAEARAVALVNDTDASPDKATAWKYMNRLAEIGILTNPTVEEMIRIYTKRGRGPGFMSAGRTERRSPMDEIYGVPATPQSRHERSPMDEIYGVPR